MLQAMFNATCLGMCLICLRSELHTLRPSSHSISCRQTRSCRFRTAVRLFYCLHNITSTVTEARYVSKIY